MNHWDDFDASMRKSEITNPAFVEYVRQTFPNKCIVPDDQDFDLSMDVSTASRAKKAYRAAQSHKLIRMYRDWRVAQN
jgi:hypothetical protein